jgi:cell division protein FtsI (penicillin-binding protein 3)
MYVRVNALDTGLTVADLAAVMPGRPDGIVLPKCAGAADVNHLALYLDAFEAASNSVQGSTRIVVVATETARAVRKMLRMAAGDGGTGPKAQTNGYSVGGKSGTAHKQENGGYAQKKFRSWFVGVAPVSDPRIVVAVMVDEPNNGKHYGGDVAAPVFSEVVQQTLRMMNVAPDIEVRDQVIARPAQQVEESF